MSATNRGAVRAVADYYPTPAWCVRAILDVLDLPGGHWLEPSAGTGAIIRAVSRSDVQWTAVELREECRDDLLCLATQVCIRSFLDSPPPTAGPFAVALLNPPFSHALEFVRRCRSQAVHVVALLRLNWLASQQRAGYLSRDTPDVYVLPRRPSFDGHGTDATEYAWLHWNGAAKGHGRIQVIGGNPGQLAMFGGR